jgi:hypothetical protein
MDRLRIAHTAALGLAIATAGCDTEDDDNPEAGETGDGDAAFALVSASLDAGGQSVVLRFSEAVAPLAGVEPSAFRISYAVPTALCGGGPEPCVDQTSYWDPNFYANYYVPYGAGTNVRFEVDMIAPGESADELSLHFGSPLDPALCEYVAYYEDEMDFLYVHYLPGDIPLESSDGESLAAIGGQWVEHPPDNFVMSIDGDFPNLDPKIPIQCSL